MIAVAVRFVPSSQISLTGTRIGNQKHYQANPDSPGFGELYGLVRKTVAVVEPIRRGASFSSETTTRLPAHNRRHSPGLPARQRLAR